jgi:8-oxo-dGTP pyrophosphatase MutT (NUDIX family)
MSENFVLSVGDQVVVTNMDDIYVADISLGMTGKVVHIHPNGAPSIGVDFGTDVNGHDCSGKCARGNGWYVMSENLTLISGEDGEYVKSLHKTKWVELCERVSKENGNYIFIREPWLIFGKAVSILPFRVDEKGVQFLVRCEQADTPVIGTIKGGCDKEGESTIATAVRELMEEAGYKAEESNMIKLGTARSSKLNTTIMHLFAVDVDDLDYTEPIGDGTLNEANAYCKWMDYPEIIQQQDPMIHATMLRWMQSLLEQESEK